MPVYNAQVITVLERALQLARQNELAGLFLVMEPIDGKTASFLGGARTPTMLGLVTALLTKAAVSLHEDNDIEQVFDIHRPRPTLIRKGLPDA